MPHPNPFTPAILLHPLRLLERKRGGLRPDFIVARSHLVDIAEIYLQFHATATLAILATAPRTVSDSFKTRFLEFLNTKLNAGHWLGVWKRAAKLVTDDPDAQRSSLADFAKLPFDTLADGQSVLSRLDALPSLRNQKRGHSYTPDPDSARADLDSAWPLVESLLDASQPLFEHFSLSTCVAVEAGVVELADLSGVALASEVASTHLVELDASLTTDDILLIRRDALAAGAISSADFAKLGPLFHYSHKGVAIYQGPHGDSSSRFMSINDATSFDIPAATVRQGLSALLPATIGVSRKRYQPPAWATQLTRHDLLTEADYREQDAHPTSFFRGNVASWSDLAHGLDIRRRLHGPDGDIDSKAFDDTTLPRLLDRARNGESPVVVFLGPAGTGKTTQLHRTAFELYRRFPTEVVVLRHHTGWEPELSDLVLAHEANPHSALAIVFDEAGPRAHHIDALRRNIQLKHIPAILLCAERPNLWPNIPADRYHLPAELTPHEAQDILDRLKTYNLLGVLSDLTREQQTDRLIGAWDGQLLVTLREATEGRRFDEIIESEYRSIPTPEGRDTYLATALLHRSGLLLPAEVAMAIGRCADKRAFRDVQRACQGALILESSGVRRLCRTRHKRIAEVLCARVLETPEVAVEEIGFLVGHIGNTRPADPWDPHLRNLAADLLASPEAQQAILHASAMPVILHLIGVPSADTIVRLTLGRAKWSHSAVRLAGQWLMRGLHVAGRRWKTKLFHTLVQETIRHDGPTAAAATFAAILQASENSDERTDQIALACTPKTASSDLDAAIAMVRNEIRRSLPHRTPFRLYIHLCELLKSRELHEEVIATTREAIELLPHTPSWEASLLYSLATDALAATNRIEEALAIAWHGLASVRNAVDCKRSTHELWSRIISLESSRGRYDDALVAAHSGLNECISWNEKGIRDVWRAIVRTCADGAASVPALGTRIVAFGNLLARASALTLIKLAVVFGRASDLSTCDHLIDIAMLQPSDKHIEPFLRATFFYAVSNDALHLWETHVLGRATSRLTSVGVDIGSFRSQLAATANHADELAFANSPQDEMELSLQDTEMPLIQFCIYPDPTDHTRLLATLLECGSSVLLFTQNDNAAKYASRATDLPSSAAIGIIEVASLPEILSRASESGHTHVAIDYEPGSTSPQILTIDDFLSNF
jgi:hypothetical protein